MSWTDERVELLRQLWLDGKSASQISTQLGHGVTRNAVIGKVHRLGLAGRAKTPIRAAAPRAAHAAHVASSPPRAAPVRRFAATTALALYVRADARMRPEPRRDVVVPMSLRVTIVELKEAMCRWPLGDPTSPNSAIAAQPTEATGPYCAHHGKLAYQPVQDRRRERERRAQKLLDATRQALLPRFEKLNRGALLRLAEGLVERIAGAAHSADRVALRPRDSALRSRPTWTSTVRSSISTDWPHTPSSNWAREKTRPGSFEQILEQPELGWAEVDVARAAAHAAGSRGRGRDRRRPAFRRSAPAGCAAAAPAPAPSVRAARTA